MSDISLRRITGQGNAGFQQFLQVATSAVVTVDFWAFTSPTGNATITQLTNQDGSNALGYLSNGVAYQNVFYTGRFKAIKLSASTYPVKLEIEGR